MINQMSKMTRDAKPTLFHHMLATLAQDDRLLRLYTQNVDGIDTSMPPLATTVPLKKRNGKWPKTVQLHGGLDKMVCSKCNALSEFDADLFDGPLAPICSACVEMDRVRTDVAGKRSHGIGRLRPRMVLYNEHNPDDEAIGRVVAEDLRKRPDAIIVVGTSLKIPGVKRIVREMCATVRDRRDGVAIWINNDPEPVGVEFKDCWDIVVRGKCDEVARHAALRRHWEMDASVEPTAEEWEEAIKNEPQVVINRTFKPISSDKEFRRSLDSPEYSPMVQRTIDRFAGEMAVGDETEVGAPPTPSKSVRSSPSKAKAKVSAFDALKTSKATGAKSTVKRGSAKATGAKAAGVKAKTSTMNRGRKAANKKEPTTMLRLNQTMTQSKAFASDVNKNVKIEQKQGLKRNRSLADADPVMRPVSPESARVNSLSPGSSDLVEEKSAIPGLSEAPMRSRMSLERVMN